MRLAFACFLVIIAAYMYGYEVGEVDCEEDEVIVASEGHTHDTCVNYEEVVIIEPAD